MLLLLIQLLLEQQGEHLDLDRRIITAKQYLEANYHRRISTKELAAVAHLSTRQLNDLFRGQLGHLALCLLDQPKDARIQEIAGAK
jgi:AraC-like DNA-binding protein